VPNINPILDQIKKRTKIEQIDIIHSCLFRGCFDSTSSEWNESTLEQKVEALTKLINDDEGNTLKISTAMMDYCNKENAKDIKPMDLVLAMSKIIDHLLREKDAR